MSRVKPTGRAGRWVLATGLACGLAAAAPAYGAEATVSRVLLVPFFGRTTVVVELSDAVAHLEHAQPDPMSVVVEGGPTPSGQRPRKFEPSGPSALVSGVTVSTFKRRDGADYFRVQIALTGQASHTVRTAGSRVYVDLSPPSEPASAEPGRPAEEVRQAAPAIRPSPAADRRIEVQSVVPPTAKPAQTAPSAGAGESPRTPEPAARPAASPKTRVDPDTAYRELESDTLARGRQMATRPDVRGLVRLREDVQKRDEQLGKLQPDLVNRVLDELSRLTDQARALQLERDRGSFNDK
jgi:hypothetical protein